MKTSSEQQLIELGDSLGLAIRAAVRSDIPAWAAAVVCL